jgi:hypothetical protein
MSNEPVQAAAPDHDGSFVDGVDMRLTDDLVDRFAVVLKAKLRRSEARHGWRNGWLNPGWRDDCLHELVRHLEKGDPVDVAAYAAFFWHHGWSTGPGTPQAPDVRSPPAPRLPVSPAMMDAGVEELAYSPAGDEARTAGGRALVRAIYRAMRISEIAGAAGRSPGDPPETEVVAVARALCARGCHPDQTDEGRHPCGHCDAGEDPAFRSEARAAIRALDAARTADRARLGTSIPVDGSRPEVELMGSSALTQS